MMTALFLAVWVVVTGEKPAPAVAYAAQEFTNAVFRCTGEVLPVVAEAPAGAQTVTIRAKGPNETLVDEQLGYRSSKGRLEIVGNQPRAALHATYQYLQRELGVRWLWPGETGAFYPARKGFTVPEGLKYTHRPSIRYRGFHLCGGPFMRAEAYAWMARNGATIHRHGVGKGQEKYGFYNYGGAHNACLDPRLFKDHPDWFAEFGGQRKPLNICWSSEEGFKEVVKVVERDISPTRDILAIFPNDTQDYCQCAECAKRSVSENWFAYYNRLVAELKKRHPKLAFSTLAYQGYRPAPTNVVPDATFVEFATHGRCNAHAYDGCPENELEASKLEAWYRLGVPMGEYTYELDVFSGGGLWLPIFSLVDDDLTHAAKHGHVVQIPETGLSSKQNVSLKDLKVFRHRFVEHFMMAKMFDASLRLEDWMMDACRTAFGPAGAAVERYFKTMDTAWKTQKRHPGMLLPAILWVQDVMTPETVKAAEAALADAERAVSSAEARYRENVADVRAEFAAWQAMLAKRDGGAFAADPDHTLLYFCDSPKHEAANFPQDRQVARQAGWDMILCTNEAEVAQALPKANNVWFRFANMKQLSVPTLEKVRTKMKAGGLWFFSSYWEMPLETFTGDPAIRCEKVAGANVPIQLSHPTFVRGGGWNAWPHDLTGRCFAMRAPSYIFRGGGEGWTTYLKCRAKDGESPFLSTHRYGKGLIVLGGERLGLYWVKILENLRAAELSVTFHMRAIAHRGLHGDGVAQNSLDSFNAAWEAGAKWIETDFHLLGNGRLLCVHDRKELLKISGIDREIASLTEADVNSIDIGKLAKTKRPVRMPYLRDVFNTVPQTNGVIVQCEIKGYGPAYADAFERARRDVGLSPSQILVTSFNIKWLSDFKKRCPQYDTGWLVCEPITQGPFDLDKIIADAKAAGCRVFCPGAKDAMAKLKPSDADLIRAAGLDFRFYAVNTPEELAAARDFGVTAFTTDRWKECFDWAKKTKGLNLTP